MSSFYADQVQSIVARVGVSVTIRHYARSTGPNPSVNPPSTSNFTTAAAYGSGAGSITLAAGSVIGYLAVGDKLAIAGDPTVYTVAAQANAANNQIVTSITPVLVQAVGSGAAVTASFQADTVVTASVTTYNRSIVAATDILMTDRRVVIPALSVSSPPSIEDVLIIAGEVYSIIAITGTQTQGATVAYDIQARAGNR
jgi:hypothetical protein